MREAKFVATVFGTVTACLFGGLAVAYTTAPNVSSRDNVEIAESASEELTIAATETSVSTTTERITTTAQTTTESVAVTFSEPEAAEEYFVPDETVSFDGINMEGVRFNAALDEPVTENNENDYSASEPVVITTEVTAAATTTKETTTTTTTTAADSSTTTTAVTATSAAPTEPAVPVDSPDGDGSLPISESDFVLLCNVVGHEAGSNWISEYDKACVVEVVMNRVNSSLYPNSIIGVLSQPYQFADYQSYAYLGTYSGYVTESVKNAVRLYFSNTEQFSHGYLSFWGDGIRNYFR